MVLCEKGSLGGEQSSRNWGWVRVMGRDSREIPLAIASLKIWDTLDVRVGGETGFRRSGILYIPGTEQDFANRGLGWRTRGFTASIAARSVRTSPRR